MDLIVKLPKTKNGYDSLVVFVDRLTKRIHLAPTNETITSEGLAKIFFDTVFRHHGLPQSIVSDRDPRFTGNFWRALFSLAGTTLKMSTSYHPQTDGQTERANRTIEESLRAYVNERHNNWDDYLTSVEYAYNDSLQASTQETPFFLEYGQHPLAPLDFINPQLSSNPAAQRFAINIQETIDKAKTQLAKSQVRQKTMRTTHGATYTSTRTTELCSQPTPYDLQLPANYPNLDPAGMDHSISSRSYRPSTTNWTYQYM
jgi:transposase InsO family protein